MAKKQLYRRRATRSWALWDKKLGNFFLSQYFDVPVFEKKIHAEAALKSALEADTMLMYHSDKEIETGKLKKSRRYKVVEIEPLRQVIRITPSQE